MKHKVGLFVIRVLCAVLIGACGVARGADTSGIIDLCDEQVSCLCRGVFSDDQGCVDTLLEFCESGCDLSEYSCFKSPLGILNALSHIFLSKAECCMRVLTVVVQYDVGLAWQMVEIAGRIGFLTDQEVLTYDDHIDKCLMTPVGRLAK